MNCGLRCLVSQSERPGYTMSKWPAWSASNSCWLRNGSDGRRLGARSREAVVTRQCVSRLNQLARKPIHPTFYLDGRFLRCRQENDRNRVANFKSRKRVKDDARRQLRVIIFLRNLFARSNHKQPPKLKSSQTMKLIFKSLARRIGATAYQIGYAFSFDREFRRSAHEGVIAREQTVANRFEPKKWEWVLFPAIDNYYRPNFRKPSQAFQSR